MIQMAGGPVNSDKHLERIVVYVLLIVDMNFMTFKKECDVVDHVYLYSTKIIAQNRVVVYSSIVKTGVKSLRQSDAYIRR